MRRSFRPVLVLLLFVAGRASAQATLTADEIIARYAEARTKTFHLELSWKKWSTAPREPGKVKL